MYKKLFYINIIMYSIVLNADEVNINSSSIELEKEACKLIHAGKLNFSFYSNITYKDYFFLMKNNLKNDLDDSYHEYEGLLYDIESIYNNNDPFIDSNEIYKKIIYVPFLMMLAYLCDQIKPGMFVKVSIGSIMSFLVLRSIIKKWDKLKKIRSWNNFKQYLKNNN